jgi:DnaJ-class molecular chaperone
MLTLPDNLHNYVLEIQLLTERLDGLVTAETKMGIICRLCGGQGRFDDILCPQCDGSGRRVGAYNG